jgi:hypothetical protein
MNGKWLSYDGIENGVRVNQGGDVTMILAGNNSFEIKGGDGFPFRRGISIPDEATSGHFNFCINPWQTDAAFNFISHTPTYYDGGGTEHPAVTNILMTVQKNGNVGIGTTTPNCALHVNAPTISSNPNRKIFEISANTSDYGENTMLFATQWKVSVGFFNSHFGYSLPAEIYDQLNVRGTFSVWSGDSVWYRYIRLSPGVDAIRIQMNGSGNPDYNYFRFEKHDHVRVPLDCGGFDIYDNTGTRTALLGSGGGLWVRSVLVQLEDPWSDFVYESSYHLLSIDSLELFIKNNKHLPNMPSADDIKKDGLNLGQMDNLLLQKIEELSLYIISQEKRIGKLEKENAEIKAAMEGINK